MFRAFSFDSFRVMQWRRIMFCFFFPSSASCVRNEYRTAFHVSRKHFDTFLLRSQQKFDVRFCVQIKTRINRLSCVWMAFALAVSEHLHQNTTTNSFGSLDSIRSEVRFACGNFTQIGQLIVPRVPVCVWARDMMPHRFSPIHNFVFAPSGVFSRERTHTRHRVRTLCTQ